jgi:preprotein translocase subunit SecF
VAHDSLASRLYRGEVSYDFIGRRKIWYIAASIIILLSILSLAIRGLTPSVDFKGGAVFQFPRNGHSVADARNAVSATGVTASIVQVTGAGSDSRFRVQTPDLTDAQVVKVEDQLVSKIGIGRDSIAVNTVGATWGSQITRKAVYGLIVFLVLVIAYLSVRFEPKMAIAAIIALLHDLVVTAGIYSLVGFEVSPSTVIALLTILGYSLYDTVVVFDKVRENTAGIAGGSRMTFSEAANLGVNQTLVRSINTSIIALLPVAGLLIIGAGLLGAGSLKDLSLALLIGLAAGAYSSIFIASPLLCDFKEREPAYQALAKRVASRRAREKEPTPATVGGRAAVAEVQDEEEAETRTPAVSRPAPAAARPGARPAAQQQRRRKGGRGGRPGGRKRR